MSDEENEALEILKAVGIKCKGICIDDVIINLIEKQSKEIEELKEDNKHQWEERCKLTFELENSTPNDKIKAKIEEVDIQLQKLKDGLTGRKTNFVNKNMLFAQKEVLQSLLEKE